MKQKHSSKEVTKENAEFFETVFGKDMKANDVSIVDKKEHIIKTMLNDGNTPTGLKIVSSIFGYLITFFTMFVPVALIISTCISAKIYSDGNILNQQIVLGILKILGISLLSFIILKIVEFLISAFMIWIYSSILTSLSGRTAVLQERIKEHLKTEDAKNNEPTESNKVNCSMNPEESPVAMAKAVERLVTLYIAYTTEKDPSITLPDNAALKRTFMAILFNIYKQGYNGKNDIPAKDVLTGVDNPFKFDILEFIIQWAKATDWFTKPF